MKASGFMGSGGLDRLLDVAQDGQLQRIDEDAGRQMVEIEQTAKELGGNPTRSRRYLDARACRYHIAQLRMLVAGRYEHVLSADEA